MLVGPCQGRMLVGPCQGRMLVGTCQGWMVVGRMLVGSTFHFCLKAFLGGYDASL
jgi:hypothetical protein